MKKLSSLYGTSSIDPELMGQRIKQIRKELSLSQRAFAKALGISQTLVGFYERGQRRVPVNILAAISEMGDVSLHQLVTGQEFRRRR